MKACVIQCGRRCVEAGGLKGFSRNCSDVGVDPKKSDGMFGVFCCEVDCNGGGGGYFELYYWKDLEDLGLVMRVF